MSSKQSGTDKSGNEAPSSEAEMDAGPSSDSPPVGEPHSMLSPGAAFRVALPNFEGPLDLLLHLIREHKIDIFDIPIALITRKYVETIKLMKELNLDIAGEFILMAATLAHIKSRMLLPDPDPQPAEEEQEDPRQELVRRLLQYQKYKAAAEELGRHDILDRDVFTRRAKMEEIPFDENEAGLVEISVFKLVEAFDSVLKNVKVEVPHKVIVDGINLQEAIANFLEILRQEPSTSFFKLLNGSSERQQIVVTFLALLEMCKLRLIRISQIDGEDILVTARDQAMLSTAEIKDDYK